MRLGSERRVLAGRPSKRAVGVPHRGRGGAPARQEFILRGNRACEKFSVGEGHLLPEHWGCSRKTMEGLETLRRSCQVRGGGLREDQGQVRPGGGIEVEAPRRGQ